MAKKKPIIIQPIDKLIAIEGMLSDLIKSGNKRLVLDQTRKEHIESTDVETADLEIMLGDLCDVIKFMKKVPARERNKIS